MGRILKQDGKRISALPVVSFCEYEVNIFTVKAGEDAPEAFNDMYSYFDFLEELHRKTFPRLSRDLSKACPKLVVFVNGLNAFRVAALERYPDAEEKGLKRQGKDTLRLQIETSRFIFRNFDSLANSAPRKVAEMFGTVNILEAMCKLLDLLAEGKPWPRLRWSLAYQAKKAFYKDMRGELWEWMKEHKVLFRTLEHYKDMFAGSKSGFLLLYATAEHKEKLRTMFHNAESWDKKSAYPSVFISDEFFPIGAPVRITKEKVKLLKECITGRKWFKIVVESKKRIPEFDLFEGTPEAGERRYGIEVYDWRTLTELLDVPVNRIKEILNGTYWKLYIVPETGMLPECFRRKIVQCYEEKNAIQDKSDPYRFMLKTMIDMIYGKPLQYKGFKSIRQVNRFYIGRGENFLMPQHSMHAVSAVRYEIMKVIKAIGSDCIKWDTDGIVCKRGNARVIFEAINEEIRAKNKLAFGYISPIETDCGVWDYEGCGAFMPLSAKSYLFRPEGGKLVFKHCGIQDRDVKQYLAEIEEDVFEHFKTEKEIQARAGFLYYLSVHKYKRLYNAFTL